VKKLCDNKLKEISLNDPKTIGTKEHMSVHIYISAWFIITEAFIICMDGHVMDTNELSNK
jgi:hypothetical protein